MPPTPSVCCLQVLHQSYKIQQVALLSQRGYAMLRVIDYFAKSLKSLNVIRNDTVE